MGLRALLMMRGEGRFSERLITGVMTVNPVAAAMAAAGDPSMQELGILTPHLKIMGVLVGAMFIVTVLRVFQLRRPDK